jgi:hypothetical protein
LYDYQIRFTRDVTLMNYFALQHGLPPVLAMVLDQNPELDGRGFQVARLAEKIMVLAHMDVISTEAYYTEYDGQKMGVSRWDGHPNRGAHRIFAHHFIQALQQHSALQSYRKQ